MLPLNEVNDACCQATKALSPGLRCFLLGLETSYGQPAKGLKNACEQGRQVDVPKILVVLSDPMFGAFLKPSKLPSAQFLEPPSSARKCALHVPPRAQPKNSFYEILVQLDSVLRSLHQNLEEEGSNILRGQDECANINPNPNYSRHDAMSYLGALWQRDSCTLQRQNVVLQARSEQDHRKYEAEVTRLRAAYRTLLRDSASSSGKTSKVKDLPEDPFEQLVSQQEETSKLLEELKEQLSAEKTRLKVLQQQAFSADQDKEEVLRLFSRTHVKLNTAQQRLADHEIQKKQLEAEIARLENSDSTSM